MPGPPAGALLDCRHGTSFVIRTTGDEHEPSYFSTGCPKAFALIGEQA